MDRKRATLIGLAAILLWSTMVGLIRSVSEGLGPVGGAAMIYTVSGLLCLVTVGFPQIRRFTPGYLIAGSLLFVSYEICLALSVGYAATRSQAIEVPVGDPRISPLFPRCVLGIGRRTGVAGE